MTGISPQVAAVASVTAGTVSTPVFPVAGYVNGRAVFNDSTATLYLKFGTAATTTSYTVQIGAGSYYEFPQPCYGGEADGVWSAVNGAARVTSW